MADDDLTGVARGAATLLDVLGALSAQGNYGPRATVEDAAALLALERPTDDVR